MDRNVFSRVCYPSRWPSGRAMEVRDSATIGTTWTLIGVVIAIGLGIMISVSSSGAKESIEIDRK